MKDINNKSKRQYTHYGFVAIRKMAKDIVDKKQKYIEYFMHMQEEDNKSPLNRIEYHWMQAVVHHAVDIDKCITRKELFEMFPNLLDYLKEQTEDETDMIHTKSNVESLVKIYQEMYGILSGWDKQHCNGEEGCYMHDMFEAFHNIENFDWTKDATKNEIRHYREVNKAYDSLMFALEAALGMEQESYFER